LTISRPVKALAANDKDQELAFSRHLVEVIERSLEDDKAEDTVVIDLSGKSSIADFMVIASGRSARQVGSMADHLQQKLKAAGVGRLSVEGLQRSDWVLIDAGDVIIHLFRPEVRSFYNLEKMWGLKLPEAERAAMA
jgi:ribosome-associated protein